MDYQISATSLGNISDEEGAALRKKAHECPMPKPKGIIGEALGFTRGQETEERPKTTVEVRKAEKGPEAR